MLKDLCIFLLFLRRVLCMLHLPQTQPKQTWAVRQHSNENSQQRREGFEHEEKKTSKAPSGSLQKASASKHFEVKTTCQHQEVGNVRRKILLMAGYFGTPTGNGGGASDGSTMSARETSSRGLQSADIMLACHRPIGSNNSPSDLLVSS